MVARSARSVEAPLTPRGVRTGSDGRLEGASVEVPVDAEPAGEEKTDTVECYNCMMYQYYMIRCHVTSSDVM